ncbi:PREDICTED: diacylglycerol kinase zeta-like [Acropora digitifera]|uniref:diacylglycerol kinase zeta-like n=1 Tax=Acropora digitifera TaxID=70779 RepID=UPI000779F992|nr:PREDICTED: diacylglycerol kinase zeta-like [Acropora digitifera]
MTFHTCKSACLFFLQDFIAISCSWCKAAYHNKEECFRLSKIEEMCDLGVHANLIVPPSWVVKLPSKRTRGSSFKRNSLKKKSIRRKSTKEKKPFVIKPSGSAQRKPLLVFINPKSGGNQGARILRKFQWLLNPRQVFDLSDGGPRLGLELYRKVPNLRILACGGDGTVGWVLSELDKLKVSPPPPVAVLPLGTGNDLSRVLNWGGGYTDEPLSRILMHIDEGSVVQLDRWNLEVSPNDFGEIEPSDDTTDENSSQGPPVTKQQTNSEPKKQLPLNVMNNYFSLGFDAEVCLEFHESREANPDKFNNRIKNLLFYGKCDGVDLTEKLQETKPLCLLFVNISSYSAGTSPWGHPGKDSEFQPQRQDDGYLEVIGLTTGTLATTRVGGHGERIAQCKEAVLVTRKTLPMQVDGEPCRLYPSRIRISRRNQANMVQKVKSRTMGTISASGPVACPEPVKLQIVCVGFKEYEKHCYDLSQLRLTSRLIATTTIEPDCDLEQMRAWIARFREDEEDEKTPLSDDWCFLDTTYPDRVYRVDLAQEKIYNVVDILEDGIFIVDLKDDTLKTQPNNPPDSKGSFQLKRPLSVPGYAFSRPSVLNGNRTVVTLPSPTRQNSSVESSPPESLEDIIESSNMTPFTRKENNFKPCLTKQLLNMFKLWCERGAMPLLLTLSLSCFKCVQPFLLFYARLFNSGESQSFPGKSCFFSSFIAKMILLYCRVKNEIMKRNEQGMIEASKNGVLDKVIELHRNGTSLSAGDHRGWRPLHYASRHGHKEIVRYIISNVPRCVLDLVEEERQVICFLSSFKGNTPRIQALKAQDKELAKYLETQEHLQIIAAEDYETAV